MLAVNFKGRPLAGPCLLTWNFASIFANIQTSIDNLLLNNGMRGKVVKMMIVTVYNDEHHCIILPIARGLRGQTKPDDTWRQT